MYIAHLCAAVMMPLQFWCEEILLWLMSSVKLMKGMQRVHV